MSEKEIGLLDEAASQNFYLKNNPAIESLMGLIPPTLLAIPQWGVWKLLEKEEGKKPIKLPCNAIDGDACRVNYIGDWTDVEIAIDFLEKNSEVYQGLAFCLTKEIGITFIDLDNCFDDDRKLFPWADEIIHSLPETYIEISQSGKGLHLLLKGNLTRKGNRKGNIEIYDSGRFIALTGKVYQNTILEIAEAQEQIDIFHKEIFLDLGQKDPIVTITNTGNRYSDLELINKMIDSNKGLEIKKLFDGQLDDYEGDNSRADLALMSYLAFWTNGDINAMYRIFLKSRLSHREKWQRKDYVLRTMQKVLDNQREGYNPPEDLNATVLVHKRQLPEIISANELLKQEFPPINWIVQDLIPEGLTMLAGPPKAGKSFLVLELAIAIATGGNFLDFEVVQGEVLYASLEDNFRRLQGRIKKLMDVTDELDKLHLTCGMPALDDGGEKWLINFLDSNSNLKLVIIDTFQRIKPTPRGGSGNAYEVDTKIFAPLQQLAIERGITIILVMHFRKQNAEDPYDKISGSLGQNGVADTLITLTRNSKRSTSVMDVVGRDIEEQKIALSFNSHDCKWSRLAVADLITLSPEKIRIIDFLKSQENPTTPLQIAKALEIELDNLRHTLRRMYKEGQITQSQRGTYFYKKEADTSA